MESASSMVDTPSLTFSILSWCSVFGRKLYKQAELFDMTARAVDPGMVPTLPNEPYTLFVSMPSFDPELHCWRPWELDVVIDFLAEMHRSCLERNEAAQ